ncbi:MAG: hypothetical protein COV44_02800 [Deltaproteobacteria bacterium CG11_big_fil_rev_8_21_14_0_20_45_16]|nr:MAG: hypothetical protein COV44_02800 [Deltaproteobacteria bacterium CG11_big_fil_rev_8_21_14_0_20_45_16]
MGTSKYLLTSLALISLSACAGGFGISNKKLNEATNDPNKNKEIPGDDGSDTGSGGDDGDGFSYRSITVDTETNDVQPIVKIGVIVDNSSSMADEQNAMATGVQNMLESLRANKPNLDFYIYTTTSEGSNPNQKPASTAIYEYQVPDGQGGFLITEDPGYFEQHTPLTRINRNALNPSLSEKDSSKIRENMSEEEFDDAILYIQSSIATIGTSGSPTEKGLCSMGRLLAEGTELRKQFSLGDLAAFIIISDANDDSTDVNCRDQARQDFGPANEYTNLVGTNDRQQTGLSKWLYRQNFQRNFYDRVQVRYKTCIVDGQERDCGESPFITWANQPPPEEVGNPPISPNYTTCTSEVKTWLSIQNGFPGFGPGEPCEYRSLKSSITYSFTDLEQFTLNFCNQNFTYQGQDYLNLEDYFRETRAQLDSSYLAGVCYDSYDTGTHQNFSPNTGGRFLPEYGETSPTTNISLRTTLSDNAPSLPAAIIEKAESMFGNDGFFVTSIIDEDALNNGGNGVCFGPPEEQGTNYYDFVLSLGDGRGSAYPICSEDYTPGLSNLSNFIQKVTEGTYIISQMEPGESVDSVIIVRNNINIPVTEGVDYEVFQNRIQFNPDVLQPLDQLIVKLKKAN